MKGRHRDINHLKDQYRYLLDQYKQIQIEIQHVEHENLERISQDRQEVDRLIRELDQAKIENRNVEEEQIRLLDSIKQVKSQNDDMKAQVGGLRSQANQRDQTNLNLRKEIEYHENMVGEQQEVNHQNYQ